MSIEVAAGPLEAVQEYLLAHPEITARFGDRVYVGQLRDTHLMPRPAVLLLGFGGASDPDVPAGFPRIEVRCYGETDRSARALYPVVRAALRRMSHPDVPQIVPETEPGGLTEPGGEHGWPFTVAFWRADHFEE